MKKIIFLGCLIIFLAPRVFAQEKIDAPVWNLGDKWVFTQGNIEVVGADQNSYTLNFSKDTSPIEKSSFEKMVFDKSTLNRIYALREDKREKYTRGQRRTLNFPMILGKEWNDTFTGTVAVGPNKGQPREYAESFKVLEWENVQVQSGNFKAIKLEYFQKSLTTGRSGKVFYWFSPDVKYFVKCQYDQAYWFGTPDWELVSFKLK